MRRRVLFSIAALTLAVLVAWPAFAAHRALSPKAAGTLFLLTHGVLAFGIVGALCSKADERAWWLGIALFGWGYLAVWDTHLGLGKTPLLPGSDTFGFLWRPVSIPNFKRAGFGQDGPSPPPYVKYLQLSHCRSALLFAMLGGTIAVSLFAPRRRAEQTGNTRGAARTTQKRGSRLALAGVAAVVVAVVVGLVARALPAGSSAGMALLLAWALCGLAILGAVSSSGTTRSACLGAAILGAGYMILIFGHGEEVWPLRLAADRFLEGFRPWFPALAKGYPASSDSVAAANARILETLERPIPLRYPEEATLEDVLKSIQNATRRPDGDGFPFYLDPTSLEEPERGPLYPVSIDLVGVPLKTSLPLMLEQLSLTYRVQDGIVWIGSADFGQAPPLHFEDSFLLIGHAALAVLAAGAGAAAGAYAARRRERRRSE